MVTYETQDRLIIVALEAFSINGYEGASIRNIAEKAEVNIAAINYHFGSKHNLYWAVMSYTHHVFKEKLKEMALMTASTEDMVLGIFDDIMVDPTLFKSAMRMMVTDGIPEPDPQYYDPNCEKGPPGIESIQSKVEKDLGKKISTQDIDWAARAIFGSLLHWSLITTTNKMQQLLKTNRSPLSVSDVRQQLLRTVSCIKHSLQQP